MTLHQYTVTLFTYMTLIPAAVICFFPMKNRIRHSMSYLIIYSALLFGITLPAAALVSCAFNVPFDILLVVLLPTYFLTYHKNIQTNFSKSIAVFAFVCALMSVSSNITVIFDALLFPQSDPNTFRFSSAAIQFVTNIIIAAMLFIPMVNYGSRLIDSLDVDSVWYATVPISLIFLTMNIMIQPVHYSTLYFNNIYKTFIWSIALLFSMMILLLVMFYFIVKFILSYVSTEQRNRILEMQERQYITQRRYIEESARVRHDFKQTIAALKSLSDAKDYDAIGSYLDKYVQSVPIREIKDYCQNNAVNALLNYYMQQAEQEGIKTSLRIDIPENLPFSDVDLCDIIGNILENAITACRKLDEHKRWIQLAAIIQNDSQLCIVATNSFDGHVRSKSGHYYSTRHSGKGIGLLSIASTAEKYGGTAEFSHEGGEFYTDIMMPINDHYND